MLKKISIVFLVLLMFLSTVTPGYCSETVPITKLGISGGVGGEAAAITLGAKKSIAVIILPRNATNKTLLWTSSDPDIASVSDGVISANRLGECTITCATTDGSNLTQTLDVVVEAS